MESVAAVPRHFLEESGLLGDGFRPLTDRVLARIEEGIVFLPRAEAEQDERFKQIIPYVVLRRRNEIYVMTRLPSGNEPRLHDAVSIGVGGHIGPEEGINGSIIAAGMHRELQEEVAIDGPHNISLVGAVNDDRNAVGRVHFGIVYEAALSADTDVSVREQNKLAGDFSKVSELSDRRDRLESWSSLVFRALYTRRAKPTPSGLAHTG